MNAGLEKKPDLSGDGFLTLNYEFIITYLDKTAAGLLGHPVEQLLGASLFEVLPKAAISLKEGFTMAVQDNMAVSFDAFLDDNHEQDPYQVRVYPTEEGVSVYLRSDAEANPTELNGDKAYMAEHEQRLRAETLAEVTLALASKTSLSEVLDEVLRQMHRLIPYRTAHIMLLEENKLRIASWQGYKTRGGEDLIANLVQNLADFPMDAQVVHEQEPLVIPDTLKEARWVVQPETAWIRSHIVAPIVLNKKVLGLIRLDSKNPGAFSAEDLSRLQPLANAAAIALENARLYDQAKRELAERKRAEEALQDGLQKLKLAYQQATIYAHELKKEVVDRKQAETQLRDRNRELALLNRVIAASAQGQEPEDILATVCRELSTAFEIPQAAAFLLDAGLTTARVVAHYNADAPTQPVLPDKASPFNTPLLLDDPVAKGLFLLKKPLIISDTTTDPRAGILCEYWQQTTCASLLVLPLLLEKDVVGCLVLGRTQANSFTDTEISLSSGVARQISGALARSRLTQTRLRLTTAIEQAAESVVITSPLGAIEYVNPAFERVSGYAPAEVSGRHLEKLLKSGRDDTDVYRAMWKTVQAGQVWQGQFKNKRKDGTICTQDVIASPVRGTDNNIIEFVLVMRDVTQQLQLEEQYRQAQKMEAIGLLAGGVAHDFNNLLTAINGYAEMLQLELPPDAENFQHLVSNIRHTGKRATSLVRQLLTFSSKQVIEPKILDVNEIVTGLEKMLLRLIGEHIEIQANLSSNLWPVRIDPNQLEQIIVNLAINAQDAMSEGGRLTIQSTNEYLDETVTTDHLGVTPGDYVMLAISDTGTGMSKAVQKHIFEPFFTTKEMGKGTGLGLSTVFGIVQQSGGHIWVYSEEGRGTTFKIYLPRIAHSVTAEKSADLPARKTYLPRGTETVLLVEDEIAVRSLALRILNRQGYTVLEAANGVEALELVSGHTGKIDLLLTDTVMPRMGGQALAEKFKQIHPDTKILFTSGYSDKTQEIDKLVQSGVGFIQKPFSAVGLAQRVRDILDG